MIGALRLNFRPLEGPTDPRPRLEVVSTLGKDVRFKLSRLTRSFGASGYTLEFERNLETLAPRFTHALIGGGADVTRFVLMA
jgi:hypothetical protein